jgi:hypothetical protein
MIYTGRSKVKISTRLRGLEVSTPVEALREMLGQVSKEVGTGPLFTLEASVLANCSACGTKASRLPASAREILVPHRLSIQHALYFGLLVPFQTTCHCGAPVNGKLDFLETPPEILVLSVIEETRAHQTISNFKMKYSDILGLSVGEQNIAYKLKAFLG